MKWLDSKSVHLVSTFARVHPVTQVKRYDKKSKPKIDIALPGIVKHDNSSMGGVDLADQLLSLQKQNQIQRVLSHSDLSYVKYGCCELLALV